MAHVSLVPLFVCHANRCRSVLARYLYVHLCQAPAASAGLDAGEWINDRAEGMLHCWVSMRTRTGLCNFRAACAPQPARSSSWGLILAPPGLRVPAKTLPTSVTCSRTRSRTGVLQQRHCKVVDPSFDARLSADLAREFEWMRERVIQIRKSLLGQGQRLVPLSEYLALCKTVDRHSH